MLYRDEFLNKQEAIELLADAMTMLKNIEKNKQMPPLAVTTQQYIALGKKIESFLDDLRDD